MHHCYHPLSSRRSAASDIPPFVMIPSQHSFVKISRSPTSLPNNVPLATGPQSWRVTSCGREWARLALCLNTAEIMRVEKGFVLPLRTPSAADRYVQLLLLLACRQKGSHRLRKGQTAGSFIFPNIDRYYFINDELELMMWMLSFCSLLVYFFILLWKGITTGGELAWPCLQDESCAGAAISCWQVFPLVFYHRPDLWGGIQ